MTLLDTVETGDMTQVLASRAGNVGSIDISRWDETKVVSILLLPSYLINGPAILGTREMWVRGVWRLVSRIPSC